MLLPTPEQVHDWTIQCMWFIALLPVAIAFLLGILVAINWARGSMRQRRARRQALREKFDPDGRLYPPRVRGVCQNCDKVLDDLYYLGDGRRLCRRCYLESTYGRQANPE